MTPTQAQVQALKKIAALKWPPYKDSLLSAIAIAKAALTAAAGVESIVARTPALDAQTSVIVGANIEAATIERCAQELDEMVAAAKAVGTHKEQIIGLASAAAAIRARKDSPG